FLTTSEAALCCTRALHDALPIFAAQNRVVHYTAERIIRCPDSVLQLFHCDHLPGPPSTRPIAFRKTAQLAHPVPPLAWCCRGSPAVAQSAPAKIGRASRRERVVSS